MHQQIGIDDNSKNRAQGLRIQLAVACYRTVEYLSWQSDPFTIEELLDLAVIAHLHLWLFAIMHRQRPESRHVFQVMTNRMPACRAWRNHAVIHDMCLMPMHDKRGF